MRANLKDARKTNKLTQSQLAQKLGIATRTYQDIEASRIIGTVKLWDTLEDLFQIPQRHLREIKPTTQHES